MLPAQARPVQDTYLSMLVVLVMLMYVAPFLATKLVAVFVAPDTDLYRVLCLLVQQLLWAAIAWWQLVINLRLPLRSFGAFNAAWKRLPRLLVVAGGLVLLNSISALLARSAASLVLGPGKAIAIYYQEQATIMGLLIDSSPLVLSLLLVTITVLTPLIEELIFRGYFHGMLKEKIGRNAIWVSSLLFASTHLYIINALPVFLMALGLTWLYEKHGNLWDNIIVHAIINGIVAGAQILRG
jgi:membrane protease YdiL (CAAX protease family)